MKSKANDLSIILPFYNEEESAAAILQEVIQSNPDGEILAVNDGSSDRTAEILNTIPGIRVLTFPENRGQSAAIYAGLRNATRAVCVILDGDGQNDPADISKLRQALTDEVGMVCGYRVNRQDKVGRKIASFVANRIRLLFIHDGIRDTGCSLKCFRREAVDQLVPFNGMHRYMAALMRNAGLSIVEIPVNHRPRSAGTSKYTNWDRALRGIYDLIGVRWLLKRKVPFNTLPESDEQRTF